MICIKELIAELGATPLDMSNAWSVDQLKDELMALEFQGLLMRQGDSPIPLIPFKGNLSTEWFSRLFPVCRDVFRIVPLVEFNTRGPLTDPGVLENFMGSPC